MRRALFWALVAGVLVFAFDSMMRADRARLCSNDATAFDGC